MTSKRKSLPLWKKFKIVIMLNNGNATIVAKLAKEFKLPRQTLQSALKNKEKIISEYEAGRDSETKRKRKHKFDAADEPLINCFKCVIDQKIAVSGEMLLLKAQEFARACGYDDTDTQDANWVNTCKAREEIACQKLHGEAASVVQCEVDDWQKHRLPELLKRFKAEEIFNADETGLFYRCLPNRSHVMKNAQVEPIQRKATTSGYWEIS